MVDLGKYEQLVRDLNALEAQITTLKDKYQDTLQRNMELENLVISLKKENSILNQQISQLESQLAKIESDSEQKTMLSLSEKDTESLKIKIRELISKIDYHLSS
ncbi:MAG: hypothetical protein Kow0098_20320 [Ignavibacteriaceae bacterium]